MAKAREIERAKAAVAFLSTTALVLFIVVVAGILYVVLTRGIGQSQAPRTYVEAQRADLEEEVEQDPSKVTKWQDLARVLIYAEDYREAARVIEKGRASQPASISPGPFMLVEAELLLAQGEYDRALELTDDMIGEFPRLKKQAEAALRAGTVSKAAIPSLGPAVPFMIDTYVLRARIYAGLEQWDEVVFETSRALDHDENAIDVITLRGKAYAELGETDKARADFKKAIKFDYEPAKQALKELGR